MKLIARKNECHAKVVVLTAGALTLLPFVNPTPAQAKPPAQAPAWGYRDKEARRSQGTWYGDHDRNNSEDKCCHDPAGNYGNSGYPSGYPGGYGNTGGYNYPSYGNSGGYNYPGGYGYPGTNGGYNGGYNSPASQSVDFQATALRVFARNRLDVRSDSGQVYSVSSDDNYSADIHDGDRVRVAGIFTGGNAIRAEKVQLVANSGYGYGSGYGNSGNYGSSNSVNFGGRVDSVRTDRGVVTLGVRGDNGQLYTVRYYSNAYFGIGERVRVVGSYANGVVNASSVSR